VQISPTHAAMRGTETTPVRCVALQGEVGVAVSCAIYPERPSPCRDFALSWSDGTHQPRCDAARRAHGLPPLIESDVVPVGGPM
jgi:uncharacterized protein